MRYNLGFILFHIQLCILLLQEAAGAVVDVEAVAEPIISWNQQRLCLC